MEFLIGSKEKFFDFLESIDKEKDKIGIFTHTDLDGIASAIFLEEILEAKGLKENVKMLDFLGYGHNIFDQVFNDLEEKEITKIFFLDISIDNLDFKNFEKLRKEKDVFLVDHHPVNELLANKNNIIKTKSSNCTAYVVYKLGEGLINYREWGWLVCSAIFADYSYGDKLILRFVQEVYPDVTFENFASTTPGINGRKIGDALIYYKGEEKKVYELVKNKNLQELSSIYDIVEEEIDKYVGNFSEKAKFYPEKKLYVYEINPRFSLSSSLSSILSKMKPDFSFVVITPFPDNSEMMKASARNQNKTSDMNYLMKKGVEGLEKSSGGGHVPAAAATFLRKDLEKFKENILKVLE